MLQDFDTAYGLKSISLRYFNAAGANPDGETGEDHAQEKHPISLVRDAALGSRPQMTILGRDYETNKSKKLEDIMDISLDRITIDPQVMNGQPCLRNLRLTVRRVVEAVALYPEWKDLQAEYPELEKEDIHQALAFAARNLDSQIIPMEAA